MSTASPTGASADGHRPPAHWLGVALVLLSAAGFGSGALFVQPLYTAGMEPLAVLFWRFASAALFGWGFLLLSSPRRLALRTLARRRVLVLLLLGVLYVGNSYAYFASLQVVPISLASIIAYLYPAMVAVMATRFLRRLEGRRAWLALALSIVGVALTVGGIPEGELPPLWGLALAFANPVVYATWIILQARLAGERPARPGQAGAERMASTVDGRAQGAARGSDGALDATMTGGEDTVAFPPGDAEAAVAGPDPSPAAALMTTATAAVYALLLVASGGSVSPLAVPGEAWLPLLGLGLLATAVAIQAFYAGVTRVGGARASLISTVEPVYTVVLAMILFGEHLTTLQVAGGGLVIAAVVLAETGRTDTVGTITLEAGADAEIAPGSSPTVRP
jgi:drug/metabolite transporter (DMT)-like permease